MAAAILCIGLCFYNGYLLNTQGSADGVVSLFAVLLAIKVLIN